MTKKELLQSKKVTLGLSNSMITDLIGFSDRTRRDYMKCKIIFLILQMIFFLYVNQLIARRTKLLFITSHTK